MRVSIRCGPIPFRLRHPGCSSPRCLFESNRIILSTQGISAFWVDLGIMKETLEFRLSENAAARWLPAELGRCIDGITRRVTLSSSSPLVAEIGEIDRMLRERNQGSLLGSWSVHRRYSQEELRKAEAFLMIFTNVVEPTGEQCGTIYDESAACSYCGSGGKQYGDLVLERRSLRRTEKLVIAKTIGGEIIVSAAVKTLFLGSNVTGIEFRPIVVDQLRRDVSDQWSQMVITACDYSFSANTRFGEDYFGHQYPPSAEALAMLMRYGVQPNWCVRRGEYKCPLGHTLGLNLISEVSFVGRPPAGSHIGRTIELIGNRLGYLRPEPATIVSPQLRELLIANGVKGIAFEIAHSHASERSV